MGALDGTTVVDLDSARPLGEAAAVAAAMLQMASWSETFEEAVVTVVVVMRAVAHRHPRCSQRRTCSGVGRHSFVWCSTGSGVPPVVHANWYERRTSMSVC